MRYPSFSLDEKKKNLKKLIRSLLELPDQNNNENMKELVLYLNQLLRVKPLTPPMSEIMIVLRDQKPALYHSTRLSLSRSSHLAMLFEINGDPILSKERLDELLLEL